MFSIQQTGRRGRAALSARVASAFTLIELLAVMTIILILAGLILSIAGNANYKAATSRAQGEIQAISTALESYKTDNGAYPSSTPPGSNSLDPTASSSLDPANNTAYQAAGQTLFQALAGVTGSGTSATFGSKSYFNYTFNQIGANPALGTTPPVSGAPLTATYFADPFGFPYGYSTDYANEIQTAAAAGSAPPTTPNGYNPTFDLWSTAGYSNTAGKTYPTNVTPGSSLWVKNW
jgi:prepilin-type N-terminal cleavage/methylation domain-containing protein